MSQSLSPAILARVRDFTSEVRELSQLAYFLGDSSKSSLAYSVLDHLRGELEKASRQIEETLGGKERRRNIPLRKTTPYFLPMGLAKVVHIARETAPVTHCLGQRLEQSERLSFEYVAARLHSMGETAGFISETIIEELPPPQKRYEPMPLQA